MSYTYRFKHVYSGVQLDPEGPYEVSGLTYHPYVFTSQLTAYPVDFDYVDGAEIIVNEQYSSMINPLMESLMSEIGGYVLDNNTFTASGMTLDQYATTLRRARAMFPQYELIAKDASSDMNFDGVNLDSIGWGE